MPSEFAFDIDDLVGDSSVPSPWPLRLHDLGSQSPSHGVRESAGQLNEYSFRDASIVLGNRYHTEESELDGVCIVLDPQESDLHAVWPYYHEYAHYLADEDLSAQLGILPTVDEVSTVVGKLKIRDLREFAASIMNIAVDSAHKGHASLDTVRLLNDWFATMEQLIAAGDDIDEILSRRKKPRESRNR